MLSLPRLSHLLVLPSFPRLRPSLNELCHGEGESSEEEKEDRRRKKGEGRMKGKGL